jgi:hypothetical protein
MRRADSKGKEFEETYTFEAAGDDKRVHLHVVMRPKGIFRLLGFVLRFAFARQIRQDHLKVKALVEGPPTV